MPIGVTDAKLENLAANILAAIQALPSSITAPPVQVLDALNTSLQQLIAVVQTIADALIEAPSTKGGFNPPASLMRTTMIEVEMSVMELKVGQTAGPWAMTFDEPDAPADGAAMSDNPAVATIALDPTDHRSWTVVALSVGTANMSYTGTSAAPDGGPAVVPNMVVTVVAAPVAEHGDFNPAGAPISGP